jgi:hypothetical protein
MRCPYRIGRTARCRCSPERIRTASRNQPGTAGPAHVALRTFEQRNPNIQGRRMKRAVRTLDLVSPFHDTVGEIDDRDRGTRNLAQNVARNRIFTRRGQMKLHFRIRQQHHFMPRPWIAAQSVAPSSMAASAHCSHSSARWRNILASALAPS